MNYKNNLGSMIESFRDVRAAYTTNNSSNYRRDRPGVSVSRSGDHHLGSDYKYFNAIEIFRDMVRNDVIIGRAIECLVRNAINEGMKVDPQTGDRDLDRRLMDKWDEWANDPEQCDVAGQMSFHDYENQILTSSAVDGDCLILPIKGGALQFIEGHLIRTPYDNSISSKNIVIGVELQPGTRRRIAYHIANDDVSLYSCPSLSATTRINAYDKQGRKNAFHVYVLKRPSLSRGVSALMPCVDQASMFDDCQFATLVKQQASACIMLLRNRSLGASVGMGTPALGSRSTETRDDGTSGVIEDLVPGLQVTSLPGETITGFSPNIPNAGFIEHMKQTLMLIGANLGIPYVMLMMDASETNFSGWRGAIDQARMGFEELQRGLITRFHRPVYTWKVRQWSLEDPKIARAGDAAFLHRWNRPQWRSIQPKDDATADGLKKKDMLSSLRRILAGRGQNIDEVIKETVEDNAKIYRAAMEAKRELEEEYGGHGVPWSFLAGVEAPEKQGDGSGKEQPDQEEAPEDPEEREMEDGEKENNK